MFYPSRILKGEITRLKLLIQNWKMISILKVKKRIRRFLMKLDGLGGSQVGDISSWWYATKVGLMYVGDHFLEVLRQVFKKSAYKIALSANQNEADQILANQRVSSKHQLENPFQRIHVMRKIIFPYHIGFYFWVHNICSINEFTQWIWSWEFQ